jgi:hypothetical protein
LPSVSRFVLVKEREFPVIECPEELVPVDVVQIVGMAKLDPEQTLAFFILGAFNYGGPASS